jgi:acetolactate synthase small subunit
MSASLQRQAITELVRLFNGKIVDVSVENLIIELCAKPSRIDAFVHLLKPYGVVEASRSGKFFLSFLLCCELPSMTKTFEIFFVMS